MIPESAGMEAALAVGRDAAKENGVPKKRAAQWRTARSQISALSVVGTNTAPRTRHLPRDPSRRERPGQIPDWGRLKSPRAAPCGIPPYSECRETLSRRPTPHRMGNTLRAALAHRMDPKVVRLGLSGAGAARKRAFTADPSASADLPSLTPCGVRHGWSVLPPDSSLRTCLPLRTCRFLATNPTIGSALPGNARSPDRSRS